MSRINLLTFIFILLLSSACAPTIHRTTKLDEFPLMYAESPNSILILPPINITTAADAKEYYSTTIQEPLAFKGFYTFPYQITTEILKMEGLYDSELLMNQPLSKFMEYFGADAVLFTTIEKWDLKYIIMASTLTVSINCKLKSTKSNQILWKYKGTVVIDLSGGDTGGGLGGLIVKAIVTAVNSAMADYTKYARQANYRALTSIPYGKYNDNFNKDHQVQIIDQTPN